MTEENKQLTTSQEDPLTIGPRLSLKQASEATGLSISYLGEIAKNKRLRAEKVGEQWTTTLAAVEAYKASRSHKLKKED